MSLSHSLRGGTPQTDTSTVRTAYDHTPMMESVNDASQHLQDDMELLEKQQALIRSRLPELNESYINSINFCRLLYITMIVSLSGFMFGYFEVFASVSLIEGSHCSYVQSKSKGIFEHDHQGLSSFEKGLISGDVVAGGCVSTLFLYFFPLADKFGRVSLIIVSNFINIICAMIAFSLSFAASMKHGVNYEFIGLITGLFGIGISIGIHCVCAPILISEYCPRYYRAFMIGVWQLFVTIGIMSCLGIGIIFTDISYGWVYVLITGLIPSIIQSLLVFLLVPQSPRWLLLRYFELNVIQNDRYGLSGEPYGNNRHPMHNSSNISVPNMIYGLEYFGNRAQNVFLTFWHDSPRSMEIATKEFRKIRERIESNVENYSFDVFWQNNILSLLLIGICLNIFQQFSGFNLAINQISSIICTDTTIDYSTADSYLTSIAMYAVLVLSTLIVVLFIQRLQYKTFMFVGIFIMLISIIFYLIFYFVENCCNEWYYTIIPLIMYMIGFSISLGPFTWIINCELFPIKVKTKYFSLCVFFQFLANFAVVSNLITSLVNNVSAKFKRDNISILFVVFGILMIVNLVYVGRKIPNSDDRVGSIKSRNALLLEDTPYSYRRNHPVILS